MKIKLFTHTDMDGAGCAILGLLAFEDIDVWYTDYLDVNADIMNFLEDGVDNYDRVYITDMSVKEPAAEAINSKFADKFTLIDHHGSAEWLNKYTWATVVPKENDSLPCGTSLFYDYLTSNAIMKSTPSVYRLVEAIRKYDTWEWKNKYNDPIPADLNMIFQMIGRLKFVERMVKDQTFFTDADTFLLSIETARRDRYIKTALYTMSKHLLILDKKPYNIGIIFAEDYISELGNRACTDNPDIDFCILINMQQPAISYRTTRTDLNLGLEIAPLFGGGGHPQAAGSSVGNEKLQEIIDIILRRS